MNPRIHEQLHQEPHSRKSQSNQKSQNQDLGSVWSNRAQTAGSLIYNLSIVIYHCLRQSILFTLVQEEEVQRLLDLLLTFDRKQLSLLLRNRKHPRSRSILMADRVFVSCLKVYDHIIHRAYDRLLHGNKRVVQLQDDRILLTTFLYQLVSAKFNSVVLIYLTHDNRIFKSRIRRDKVPVL